MNVTQPLQKWGNSAGVRIPKKVIQAAKLHIDQTLVITLQDKSILLTPVNDDNGLTLEALLLGVSPDKVGGELGWGEDVGAEKYE